MQASVAEAPGLQSAGSVVVAQELSYFKARGIFPDLGLNPGLLHRQADSLPLTHQGSPVRTDLITAVREQCLNIRLLNVMKWPFTLCHPA